MPLPTPILDDRSYQQLRDELVRRIPVYNPEWTDHNPSDPGITLLELFAFLGENVLYRFNQIPETTKLAFLQLLRVPLRPAVPAQSMVTLTAKVNPGEYEPPRVDLGSELKAGDAPFETLDEVTVAPWRMVAAARTLAPRPDPKLEPEANDFATAALDAIGGLATGETAAFYKLDVLPDDPSKPGAVPIDFGKTVDGTIWIAVVADKDTSDPGYLQAFCEKGLSINVGFVPDLATKPIEVEPPDPCPGVSTLSGRTDPCLPPSQGGGDPVPEVVWEISSGALDAKNQPLYTPLVVTGDTTQGMTRPGVVRLRLPSDPTKIGPFTVADPDAQGTGELPPVLTELGQDEQVLFWLRAWHREASHHFGSVLWMGANAATVEQRRTAPPELLGTGNGQAGQVYRLRNRPVVEGSLVVEVEEQVGARWTRWLEVDDFDASGEDAKVYVVDREAGEVRFGNGVHGFAPQLGQRVRATQYQYGGGDAGNVAAGAISKLTAPPPGWSLTAKNPLPASGGAPAETIAAALERLPGELRRHDRAVTTSDFQELALATPGADLGRAECLPHFDPKTLSTEAAGKVTVVVWPREDRKHPSAPAPDKTTVQRVCAWLDKRRLVTTELYVIPPSYVKVAVAIGINVRKGYGVDAVRSWVELVVRQFLAPLPPYGPEGSGWPLGQPVYGPEIEAAILQVEGVEYVDPGQVAVAHLASDGVTWVSDSSNRVTLKPHQVPELASITVVAGQRLEPGQGYTPPPGAGDKIIPIPTIVEEC